MRWIEALKIWNAEHNVGKWCVVRKGSPEYDQVKAIQNEGKVEAEKARRAALPPKERVKMERELARKAKAKREEFDEEEAAIAAARAAREKKKAVRAKFDAELAKAREAAEKKGKLAGIAGRLKEATARKRLAKALLSRAMEKRKAKKQAELDAKMKAKIAAAKAAAAASDKVVAADFSKTGLSEEVIQGYIDRFYASNPKMSKREALRELSSRLFTVASARKAGAAGGAAAAAPAPKADSKSTVVSEFDDWYSKLPGRLSGGEEFKEYAKLIQKLTGMGFTPKVIQKGIRAKVGKPQEKIGGGQDPRAWMGMLENIERAASLKPTGEAAAPAPAEEEDEDEGVAGGAGGGKGRGALKAAVIKLIGELEGLKDKSFETDVDKYNKLIKKLVKQGYTAQQITRAMGNIYGFTSHDSAPEPGGSDKSWMADGFRVRNAVERSKANVEKTEKLKAAAEAIAVRRETKQVVDSAGYKEYRKQTGLRRFGKPYNKDSVLAQLRKQLALENNKLEKIEYINNLAEQHRKGKSLQQIAKEESIREFGKVVDFRRTGKSPTSWGYEFGSDQTKYREREANTTKANIALIEKALRTESEADISAAEHDEWYMAPDKVEQYRRDYQQEFGKL